MKAFHTLGEGWKQAVGRLRSMTTGQVLCTLVIIKLIIIFVFLKLFFFSDFLSKVDDKPGYVGDELLKRSETVQEPTRQE